MARQTEKSSFLFTRHFLNDRQHRDIFVRPIDREVFTNFGDSYFDGRGAKIVFLSDRSFKMMRAAGIRESEVQDFEKRRHCRVVIALDSSVITAYHADSRHRRVRRSH